MGEQYSTLCRIITISVHHHRKARASKILGSMGTQAYKRIEAVNNSYLHNDLTILAFIASGHSAINYCIDQKTNRETSRLWTDTGLEQSYPIACLHSFSIVVMPNSAASGYNRYGLYSYFICQG